MKKWVLILSFILIVQTGHKIVSVLAEEAESTPANPAIQEEDSTAVKKTINDHFQCINLHDINCLMSHISKEFSGTVLNGIVNYDGLKLSFEDFFKNTVDESITDVNINELNVSDGKATAVIEYATNGFSMLTNTNFKVLRKVRDTLIKEDGTWKIASIMFLSNVQANNSLK